MLAQISFVTLFSNFFGNSATHLAAVSLIICVLFYFFSIQETRKPDFERFKLKGEDIVWIGRPGFIPYVATALPFLIIAFVWSAVIAAGIREFAPDPDNKYVFYGFWALSAFPVLFFVFKFLQRGAYYPGVHYVVTNKRVIATSGLLRSRHRSIDLVKIEKIITFSDPLSSTKRSAHVIFSAKASPGLMDKSSLIAFWGIENFQQIYTMVRALTPNLKVENNLIKSS